MMSHAQGLLASWQRLALGAGWNLNLGTAQRTKKLVIYRGTRTKDSRHGVQLYPVPGTNLHVLYSLIDIVLDQGET